MKTLIACVVASISFSAHANVCSQFFLGSSDKIMEALKNGSGFVSVFHIEYGEGYLSLDKKTNQVSFGQNRFEENRVENIDYRKGVALTLSDKVVSVNDISRNMPFFYNNKIYKALGQFVDGSILAKNIETGSIKKISLNSVKQGVLAMTDKNLSEGDSVIISSGYLNHTMNAHIVEIQGLYAKVYYGYESINLRAPRASSIRYTVSLIPLTQLKRGVGEVKNYKDVVVGIEG